MRLQLGARDKTGITGSRFLTFEKNCAAESTKSKVPKVQGLRRRLEKGEGRQKDERSKKENERRLRGLALIETSLWAGGDGENSRASSKKKKKSRGGGRGVIRRGTSKKR